MLWQIVGFVVLVISTVSLQDTPDSHGSDIRKHVINPQDESDSRKLERILDKFDAFRDLPARVERIDQLLTTMSTKKQYTAYETCLGSESAQALHSWLSTDGDLRRLLLNVEKLLERTGPSQPSARFTAGQSISTPLRMDNLYPDTQPSRPIRTNDEHVRISGTFRNSDAGTDWVQIKCAPWRHPDSS